MNALEKTKRDFFYQNSILLIVLIERTDMLLHRTKYQSSSPQFQSVYEIISLDYILRFKNKLFPNLLKIYVQTKLRFES